MIRILASDQTPLRVWLDPGPQDSWMAEIYYSDRYGFVSSAALDGRKSIRRNAGLVISGDQALFALKLCSTVSDSRVEVSGAVRAEPMGSDKWRLQTADNVYFLERVRSENGTGTFTPPILRPKENSHARMLTILTFIFLFIFIGIKMLAPADLEVAKQEKSEAAPVILRPTTPVAVKEPTPAQPVVDPKTKARRAVTQQLGFLGSIGKKDLQKIKGGLPSEVEKKTAGAGLGGDAGSGGEMLAGMGRGLHETSLGNSGVKGLGGLGTRGAGGGAGGYGDTSLGGAGGQTLSAIPIQQDAKIDEGLDRSQIQSTILRYLSQVRACYEEGLKRNQNLIGQVTMNFEVNMSGGVNFSRVSRSSLGDKAVEECISSKMMYWKFPEPRGKRAVGVTYPFMLRPVKS